MATITFTRVLEQPLPGYAFRVIPVEGDAFDMGGESWSASSKPIHPVEVSDFWMGEVPATQALWEAVLGLGNNPSWFKGQRRPVETVSWRDITETFLPRLNQLTEETRPKGTLYRLPTEAEWEYAARGGRFGGDYVYAGSNKLDEVGWYRNNSHDETKPVGLKLPNELGLYDMSGNVWEWCEDWYGSDYYQTCLEKGTVKNPTGPDQGADRVCRGGSWRLDSGYCRSSYRNGTWPGDRPDLLGFRLVLGFLAVSGGSAGIP